MNAYLIYTDSAADIPQEIYAKYDIRIIPMDYVVNEKLMTFYTERADHDQICDSLYRAQREGADVHTSQITPFRYTEIWTKELEEGQDILYLSFSSGMSATWQNAVMAAEELKENYPDRTIRVIDSLSATGGQGVLTYTAAINREKGMSLEENAAWLEANAKYMCHRFTVGDLDYLHKGGRISGAAALVGGLLNIKPVLIIDDEGKLEVVSKCRGKHAALKMMVKSYQTEQGVPDVPKHVFITHSGLYEEAEKLKEMVEAVAEAQTQVYTICQTPIIGSHTGPDFLSVCGFGYHRKQ